MASSTRAFFVGVGTTIIILGVGFGGGLLLAKSVMKRTSPTLSYPVASRLPPARIVLPVSSEPARLPEPSAQAAQIPAPASVPPLQSIQAKDAQPVTETDKQAERAERRQSEVAGRERRKRAAERKARQEAVRVAKRRHDQQQEQQSSQPGIMAFGGDNEQSSLGGGLFGN